MVLFSGRESLGNVCASDAVVEAVEEMQYTFGEGPCVDAFRGRRPVSAPDLAEDADGRWPEFRAAALAAGMRAAFGFPLLVGPTCIGALNLFNDCAGSLTAQEHADAVTVAHVAGRTVLSWQSVARPGALAWQLEHLSESRAVVHQATGMISVQVGIPVDGAIVVLRAHAFAEDRPISAVAADVVGRSLRFD